VALIIDFLFLPPLLMMLDCKKDAKISHSTVEDVNLNLAKGIAK
jgi:hypothetical protein